MKSTKEKGTEAEKYAASFLKRRGYLTDIHPRTSTFTGKFYVSRENDYFNAFDVMGFGPENVVLVQVTDMQEDETNLNLTIQGGNVAKRKTKIENNFPVHNPDVQVLVFLTQKRWVKRPGEHRHKEYYHRAWRREFSDEFGFIWVERAEWSDYPPPQQTLKV